MANKVRSRTLGRPEPTVQPVADVHVDMRYAWCISSHHHTTARHDIRRSKTTSHNTLYVTLTCLPLFYDARIDSRFPHQRIPLALSLLADTGHDTGTSPETNFNGLSCRGRRMWCFDEGGAHQWRREARTFGPFQSGRHPWKAGGRANRNRRCRVSGGPGGGQNSGRWLVRVGWCRRRHESRDGSFVARR
jgi:hypothetical protein